MVTVPMWFYLPICLLAGWKLGELIYDFTLGRKQ